MFVFVSVAALYYTDRVRPLLQYYACWPTWRLPVAAYLWVMYQLPYGSWMKIGSRPRYCVIIIMPASAIGVGGTTGVARIFSGGGLFPQKLATFLSRCVLNTQAKLMLNYPLPAKIFSKIWLLALPAGGGALYNLRL